MVAIVKFGSGIMSLQADSGRAGQPCKWGGEDRGGAVIEKNDNKRLFRAALLSILANFDNNGASRRALLSNPEIAS